MSTVTIPVRTDQPFYRHQLDLEGSRYHFAFNYNAREDRYYMTLSDAEDDAIVSGVKVLLELPLLRKVTDIRRPPGEIFAIDTSGANLEAGEGELGDRVQLVYEESS